MARAAGGDRASIDAIEVKAPGGVRVTNDPERADEGMRANTAFYMARMDDLHLQRCVRAGLGEEARAVRRAWDAGGSSAGYEALPMERAKQFGYAGPVEGCIEWLEAERGAGYTILPVSVDARDPAKQARIHEQLFG